MSDIQGVVEEVVFKNEENGYVVAKLKTGKETITIIGTIPYINEGQNLSVKGEWVLHPHFGRQLKVDSCEEILPSTVKGIETYLASGVIFGIGPVTAKKIVEKFGEKSLDVLENHIELLKDIEGIGDKKLDIIYESYCKQREVKDVIIFLQSYGISNNQCVKIYNKFGNESVQIVKNNPYVLTEQIRGIGFKTADKIAKSMGIETDSPFRIQSGIKYVINEFCAMGNTYMPIEKVIKNCMDILTVKREDVEKNLIESAVDGKIKIEKVDGTDCVFTLPYYYCELSITKKILTMCYSAYDKLEIDIDKKIEEFEHNNSIKFAATQKEAIAGIINNGVEIITGGPGTGKTTIINCILNVFEELGLTVMMGAPTGRAAKRMTEATGREAKTIHRLLELGYGDDDTAVFEKGEDSPLECDVIIIDEASMVDVMLMNNLLQAIALGTRIIIVGDVDQLPSVGAGNVLRDLIESSSIKVVKLNEIFRQSNNSLITINAHRINNGEMPILNEKDKDFYFIREEDPMKIKNTLIDLINKRLPKFNQSWDRLRDMQILTPMRKGTLGVYNLNKELQKILNAKDEKKEEREFRDTIFRVGDKVMQTKNNYSLKWIKINRNGKYDNDGDNEGLGVYNGDIGFIDSIDNKMNTVTVIFDDERQVVYDSIYLDELELAYSITIHKSQGSEFPVVIIPSFMGPPMLMNRNLIYTGITRAKKLVVVVGSIKALNFMITNNRSFERYSSLKWRIEQVVSDNAEE
ncbi:ATP-dependent RecD-like DNA helicase [Clostridium oryzae]|uniref:ATP-dependent RecD2 DNA helicase n=1 Tax=Clostridium oryzae TaxID=1450648 RepID=A0A1V4IUE7_9CLOT|nr:ATP-dependent RecD-like DNA helicase [Clostridium oryzae]OPJ63440.1 ATP-dependent RecD-like DNA helicase [Clostridium oryzae]